MTKDKQAIPALRLRSAGQAMEKPTRNGKGRQALVLIYIQKRLVAEPKNRKQRKIPL
ncbi:MAG: hypothetical protein ACXW2S_18885 [Telluria sp.]